jgi:hypothetical protein
MYALLIVLFTLAIGANAMLGALAHPAREATAQGETASAAARMPVQ